MCPKTPETFHTEAPLLNRVLLELSRLGCLAWKNPTGVGRAIDDPKRVIRFGLRGSPDILAILPGGYFLGVEIKTKNDRQRPEQKAFQEQVEKRQAYYAIVRHPDQVAPLVAGILAEVRHGR